MFKKILIITIASLGILACGTEADFENVAGIEIETEELRNTPDTMTPATCKINGGYCEMKCDDGSICSGPCDRAGLEKCCAFRLGDEDPQPNYTRHISSPRQEEEKQNKR